LARDNFPKSLISILKDRVSNRCSNPDCRVPTSGPSGGEKVSNIGVAAHITAASKGGPRYDNSIDSVQRKSIDNAIWLCHNCSIDIDRDEVEYTVDRLKEWKEKAERTTKEELGKKLPSKNDALDMVVMALNGSPRNFLHQAILNTHRATEKSLELLDPRFKIKSNFDGHKTQFHIHAKEDVTLNFYINLVDNKNYEARIEQLHQHAREFEIDAGDFKFEGSKLFETLCERRVFKTLCQPTSLIG